MKVAIVILNWNGSGMLKRYMPTLLKYSAVEGAQVYVADNASSDDSMEMMRREFPQVPLIELEKNWGFAKGHFSFQRCLSDDSQSRARLLHTTKLNQERFGKR